MKWEVGKLPSGRPMPERIARPSIHVQKVGTVEAPTRLAARAEAIRLYGAFGVNETSVAVHPVKAIAE